MLVIENLRRKSHLQVGILTKVSKMRGAPFGCPSSIPLETAKAVGPQGVREGRAHGPRTSWVMHSTLVNSTEFTLELDDMVSSHNSRIRKGVRS